MFQSPQVRLSPRWATPRNFAIALAIVISLAVVTLLALQRYSARQYDLALTTDELGLAAYDLSAAGLRVALTHQPSTEARTSAQLVDAAAARIALARSLMRLEADAKRLDDVPLQGKVEQFSNGARQLQTATLGENFTAVPAIEAATTAEFATLSQYIRESSRHYADRAEQAQLIATLGRVLVVLVTAAVIGLMYSRFRTVQREAEKAAAEQEVLRRTEASFRPLVQSSSDVIAVINADNVVTYVSPAVERITGKAPDEIVGHPAFEPVGADERRAFEAFLLNARRRANAVATTELAFSAPDGLKHLELVCTNLLEDEDVRGLVLNIRDVTERKRLEEQLRFQAFHDALTGLANGSLFTDRLEHGLARAQRSGRGQISVIYLDLDRFKRVNDELGHQAGDQLLREVGTRLTACIRTSDTAARLGGDEFAILIEDAGANSKARDIADRVLIAMAEPFEVKERGVAVSASIGVIVADPQTMSAGDVMRYVDLAMYDAKHHGRNRVHHFQPAMLLALADLDSDAAAEAASTASRKAVA